MTKVAGRYDNIDRLKKVFKILKKFKGFSGYIQDIFRCVLR